MEQELTILAEVMPLAATTATATVACDHAAMPTLHQRAVRAAAWQIGVTVVSCALRVLSGVILARLLSPAAFGLMSLAYVVNRGLAMFSELGVGSAIIQSRRGAEAAFLNTAWTIQLIRGFFLFLGALALAWPAAWFYGERAMLWLLPVTGLGAIISGFQSTAGFTLNRVMDERRRSILGIGTDVFTRLVMVSWAWVSPTVAAIAGATLLGTLLQTTGSHVFLRGVRNRLQWNRDAAVEIMQFGRWVFIGTVIAFFGQQLDQLLLGKLTSTAVLGVYAIGMTLMRIPEEATSLICGGILYPVLSEVHRENAAAFGHRVDRIRGVVLQAALALVLATAAAAPLFFGLLYDARYQRAIWISQLGIVWVWYTIMYSTSHKVALALGDTRLLAYGGAVNAVAKTLGCLIGYRYMGIPGFVLGLAAGPILAEGVVAWSLSRRGLPILAQDIRFTSIAAVMAGLMAVSMFATTGDLAGWRGALRCSAIPLLIALLVAVWAGRQLIPILWSRGKN